MRLFTYPFETCVLGAQKNRFMEMVLLSTHNICFGWEIIKIIISYTLLSWGLDCFRHVLISKSRSLAQKLKKRWENPVAETRQFGYFISLLGSHKKSVKTEGKSERLEKAKNQPKPFCDICGKVFERSSCVNMHKLIHSGVKPFKCTICAAAFTQKGNLKRHILQTHFKMESKEKLL